MKTWNNGIIVLIACLAPAVCGQSALDAPQSQKILSELSEKSRDIKSLAIKFQMDREVKLFSDSLHSEGLLLVQLPDSLRWETTKPFASALILNGGKAVKFTKEQGVWKKLEFAGIDLMIHALREILQWQRGDFRSASDNYNLKVESGPTITLEPKSEVQKKQISKIELRFSPATFLLIKAILQSPGGDEMKISFSDIVRNPVIAAEKFSTDKFLP